MNYQAPSIQSKEVYIKNGPVCYQEVRHKQWYLTQFYQMLHTIFTIDLDALKHFHQRPFGETEALILHAQKLRDFQDQLIAESGYPL